jgi:uncharacterized delta-60 repeat protein
MDLKCCQITRIVIFVLLTLFLITGCKGGVDKNPIDPTVNYDPVYLTLQRAADALEKDDLEACLNCYLEPESSRKTLSSLQGAWKTFATALREAKIVRADSEQVRLELRFERPDIPGEFMTFNFYVIKTEDGNWLLNPTPIKYFNPDERKSTWDAPATHCSLITKLIIQYYVANYPQDVNFTGPAGLLNPDSLKYNVYATHPDIIDWVFGVRDIYNVIPPEAELEENAPTALLQIGAVDEDIFLGEYLDSAKNMKPDNRFKRDVRIENNPITHKTSIITDNKFEDDDDTILKGHAHFMTPENNSVYQENNFIGFNDLKVFTYHDISGVTAPSYKWGLGLENIGPFSLDWGADSVEMRENWNRKTWQYATELYKEAIQIPDVYDPVRLTKMGNSFYALGHVLHLLEDCGNPAHVRNDMHGINWLYFVPGFDFVKPDPFEQWSKSKLIDTGSDTILNQLISEANPIKRDQNGFSESDDPLLYYYYNNPETQYPGYEALFKNLAYITNRTFVSEDTIGRSTQSDFAKTQYYPNITRSDNVRGKIALYGKAELPFYNEEQPLAVATSDFYLLCYEFFRYFYRWPTLDEVKSYLPVFPKMFTTWDDWDDDYYSDGRKGVMETAWEVQMKRIVRHGAALLHEFYISVYGYENPSEGGNLIWAKRAGGTGYEDRGRAITNLSDNSTVMTGTFAVIATFGPGEPNETILTSTGYEDIFITRYYPDGILAWAKHAGGSNRDWGRGITTLSDNSIVTTGNFAGKATFGPGEPNQTILTSMGDYDIFMARYNPNGTLSWAKRAGGSEWDVGLGITTLSDNSTVVIGKFKGIATFGPGEPNETILTSAGNDDIFVTRYNSDGTLSWAKRAGGSSYEEGLGITMLSDNSIVTTGYFDGTITFGQGEPNETILTSAGYRDIFIARFNPDGTLLWAKRTGGSDHDFGRGITTLSDNSTVVTGFINGTVTFGEGEPNETILTSAGGEDIFIARYNPNGTLSWAKCAGGSSSDYSSGITTLSDNSTVMTGMFWNTATFGQGEPNETILTSAGNIDIFIARYNPDGTIIWAKRAGGSSYDDGLGITMLSDNSIVTTGYFEGTITFGPGEPNQTILTSAGSWDIFIARFEP